jgi:hypothetical protein
MSKRGIVRIDFKYVKPPTRDKTSYPFPSQHYRFARNNAHPLETPGALLFERAGRVF